MGVVDFVDEVGNRQLQLMSPEPAGLVGRRQAVTGAEKGEDIGGLPDDEVAGPQKRRGEGQRLDPAAAEQPLHLALTARLPCNIGVVGARFLEGEPHKLAAALNPGPIVELILHLVRASCDANPRLLQRHLM